MPGRKLKTQKENASFRKAKLKTLGFGKKNGIWNFEFGAWQFVAGFTFIELLVVISLMAIVAASVSAAYMSFERNQRVKQAALTVKNEIRASQNNASSGKDVNCTGTNKLVGWLFVASAGSNVLSYGAYCGDTFSASNFNASRKIFKLPQGVTISDVKYGSTSMTPIYIFYRTLGIGFTFHNAFQFLDSATGDLQNLVGGGLPQDPVTIILTGSGVTYGVVVMPSGEVYEKQM